MDQQTPPSDQLAALAAGDQPLLLALLSLRPDLLATVQDRLAHHGLLDPPADRFMGPVTTWALAEFARLIDESFDGSLTPAMAHRLISADPLLPLHPGSDLPGRLVRTMLSQGYWLCRHPNALTIAYLEHTEPDGRPSPARPNAFDDSRFLLRIAPDGRPTLAGAWHATTRSGRDATDNPADERGPPILRPGQYKAWVMGRTAIGTEQEQDALVQCLPLPVTRDADTDGDRHGDPDEHGLFVIDQHGGLDAPRDDVGDASAGCLVTPCQSDHEAFLAALRTDPRYRANNAYRFMTTLLRPQDMTDDP